MTPHPRHRRDARTATGRAAIELRSRIGLDLKRIRTDAGLSLRVVAVAAGIDPSHLSLIERGRREASLAVLAAVGSVLGLDVSVRLFPTTGPTIRDRHQASIVEALLRNVHHSWRRIVEVAVRSPARGVIDAVLAREIIVAVEVHSELRSVEQLIRWTTDKADSLPSAAAWQMLSATSGHVVQRLLIVRSTRANREIVRTHDATFRAAFPGDPTAARAALTSTAPWPGSAILWARSAGGAAEMLSRRPPMPAGRGPGVDTQSTISAERRT